MSYLSLALINVGRVLSRRNSNLSLINVIIVALLIVVWATIFWFVGVQSNEALVLRLTILAQAISVCALVAFSRTSSWQKYFSQQTTAWLETMPAILFSLIISLATLLPYYLAQFLPTSSYLVLKLLTVLLICLSGTVTFAAIGLLIRRATGSPLIRVLLYAASIVGAYYLASSGILTVINTGLQSNTINTAITVTLLAIGLYGFSVALFELISGLQEKNSPTYQFSLLLSSFRIFGLSADQLSSQILNTLIYWLRNVVNQYLIVVLIIGLYGIEKIGWAGLIDQRGAILLFGVIVTTFVTKISFSNSTRSQLQKYHWLPVKKHLAATSDWLAGVVIYALVFAIIYWFFDIMPLPELGLVAATALITHTLTVGIAYYLNGRRQHSDDRLTLLVIGGALLGLMPGLFYGVVPTNTSYALLGIWLVAVTLLSRLINRDRLYQN